jgi:hypothetical protein
VHETSALVDPAAGVDELVRDSLLILTGVYAADAKGELWFIGERPSGGWHVHGWCEKTSVVLQGGLPRSVVVHKRRWLLAGTYTTCHSRPPDDLPLVRFCTLIVVLRIWAWVSSAVGFHNRRELLEQVDDTWGSDRTVQRWTARAMGSALNTQQAIRAAILELRRREPRPEEDWFRGGLSPPSVVTRRWSDPASHQTLWRAIAMLFVGAKELGTHVSSLLAEARRRWHPHCDSFPI